MLMLRGQGGEVELCPKATHYCQISRYPFHFNEVRCLTQGNWNLWKPMETFHWFHDVSRFAYVCLSKNPSLRRSTFWRPSPICALWWKVHLSMTLMTFHGFLLRQLQAGHVFFPWKGGEERWLMRAGRCWKTSFSIGTPSQGAMQASSKCSSQFNTVAFRV